MKDMSITLDSEIMESLVSDCNEMFQKTVGKMTMKGASEAVITVKIVLSIAKDQAFNGEQMREIAKFGEKHDIKASIQTKDKMSGQLTGDVELVWDEKSGEWVARYVDNGQTSIFEKEDDYPNYNGKVVNFPESDDRALPPPTDEGEDNDSYEYVEPEE